MAIVYIIDCFRGREEMKYTTKTIDLMLFAMIGSHELVKKWWINENKYFGTRPIDVWERDEEGKKEVFDYVAERNGL